MKKNKSRSYKIIKIKTAMDIIRILKYNNNVFSEDINKDFFKIPKKNKSVHTNKKFIKRLKLI